MGSSRQRHSTGRKPAPRSAAQAHSRKSRPTVSEELADVIQRLEMAQAVIATAVAALISQGADIDPDVAHLLRVHAGAELGHVIERLKAVEGAELHDSALAARPVRP